MERILIFGNSGSGKSTLAMEFVEKEGLAHLDLDTVAWLPTQTPVRMALENSNKQIQQFIQTNDSWVIEGCYTDLLELVKPYATEVIFMNLPVEHCLENAMNRSWEPHKYESKEAQDKNLAMLKEWILQYHVRDDVFSYKAHAAFYANFTGPKKEFTNNERKRLLR